MHGIRLERHLMEMAPHVAPPRNRRDLQHLCAYVSPNRLVFSGGGELDKEKTADLMDTLREPSRMRGNDPTALQNPCRPTVIITDTVGTTGGTMT